MTQTWFITGSSRGFGRALARAALGYVIYANAADPAFGRPSLIVTAVVLVLSALYYPLRRRLQGDWVLRGHETEPPDA